MTVSIVKPAVNLREKIAMQGNQKSVTQEEFYFSGDASTTDFPLPRGWVPKRVWVNGLKQRIGASEDYTVVRDVNTRTVSFAVAPAAVNIDILAEREV